MSSATVIVRLFAGRLPALAACGFFLAAMWPIATWPIHCAAADRPNVVVVITDDQGYGDIAFHGNTEIQTPTIDALARSSLRLTSFHSEPTCAETRAALLTGQFPARNGVWHTIMGRSILRKSAVTLPQLFKRAGYRTGMFGKWHLGDNYPYRPQHRGFDRTLHHGGGGITQLPDVWGNDYFDDVYWANDRLQPVRGYCTDVFFNAAKDFIKADAQEPFFCYLATNAPHSPYNVSESYKKPYTDKGIPEPRANFYGMITNIDDNLASLLAVLDERGIADNTVVVFMTDNGSAAGYVAPRRNQPQQGFNAGMRANKGSQYDGGHRVPCFIRYPKVLPTNHEFDKLCAHVDLVPTLAELCQLDTSAIKKLDGRSLVGFVKQTQPWTERTLVVQSHRVEEPVKWRKSAVMTQRWRLIDGEELYDIQADPSQSQPLTGDSARETIDQLRAAYEQWWDDVAIDPSIFSSIQLGARAAPRVRLTGHDWHGPQPTVMQDSVKKDPVAQGHWAVDVTQPGVYQFLLSRRPLEEPGPIGCVKAKITIAGRSLEQTVEPTAVLAPLTLRLPVGETKLETQLIAADGTITSAYFATVNYLGDVPDTAFNDLPSRLPSWVHAGDRIAWLGGTLIERAAGTGALETEMLLRAPLAGLSFVNLGWSGDDYTGRARAVFGSAEDGNTRRLNDLRLSGASLVMIAYGMGECLDEDNSSARLDTFDNKLRELVAAIRSEGRRAALCLPPELIDNVEGTAAQPNYDHTSKTYNQRRKPLIEMLRRVAQDENLPTIELPAIESSMFESGTYLSRNAYRAWASNVAEAIFATAPAPINASRASEQKLVELASESARLFFDMHRPQNETYLLLFRKHEQGNNAVELGQYRPLIADTQLELIRAAAQSTRR